MRGVLKSGTFWFAFSAVVFLVVGIVSSVVFWGWLHPKDSQTASNSETVRNLGILIGGVLAFVFALWRGWVAERQAAAAQRQVEIALQQAATAQRHAEIARQQASTSERGLLNERYQNGAEMLGSDVLSVRLGGIYALQHLAAEHSDQYHVQIMRLFCAFVRNPKADIGMADDPKAPVREDVQAVMDAIGTRSEHHLQIEQKAKYRLNLCKINLRHVSLTGANLRRADFSGSILAESWMDGANLSSVKLDHIDLSGADLTSANLSCADLTHADLSCADFTIGDLSSAILKNADLSGADLTSAKLSGTEFSFYGENPARGLTQSQLDNAWPQPDNSPNLEGVVDAETGRLLVWKWGSLKDDADGDR